MGFKGVSFFMDCVQSEIMSKPELFVEPDPELPLALLDQKEVFPANSFLNGSMLLKNLQIMF